MWGYGSKPVFVLEPTREWISLWYILGCCIDGISPWIRSTYHCYLRWKPWVTVLCIFLVGYLLWCFAIEKLRKQESLPSLNIIPYKFTNIQIPQHILLDIANDSQPKCERIFETIIPNNIRSNITDKELVQSLFENKINSAYRKYNTKSNETTFIIQGKLCSNTLREWLFFTTFEKESLKQFINENPYAIETSSNRSQEAYECVSFDFEKCSLINLQNDFPRLFQFDHEQHIEIINNDKRDGTDTEIVQIVYYYIRRKASDYIKYEAKFKEIDTLSLNLTIIPDLITSHDIHIKVKITQNKTSITNMNCVTTLKEQNSNRTSSLEMVNPVIKFNQLSPSTSYDVCVSCKEINEVCKQIKTSERSSFEFQYDGKISFIMSKPVALVIIIILLVFLTAVALFKPTTFVTLCHCQSPRPNPVPVDPLPIVNPNGDINEEERSNANSLLTASCISVRETRGSISSIHSAYINYL